MATETPESEQEPGVAAEPSECTACRGTGKVVAAAGKDDERTLDCPWCEGSGRFIPGHDAQAHWRGEGESSGEGEAA